MRLFKKEQQISVNKNHMHAWCLYEQTSWRHFLFLLMSVIACKIRLCESLTTHLPLELQHHIYPAVENGKRLTKWGKFLAALTRVNFYWENAPLLNIGSW